MFPAGGGLPICSSIGIDDKRRSRVTWFGTLLQIYFALLLSELLLEALYHEEKSIMNQLCLIISPRDH